MPLSTNTYTKHSNIDTCQLHGFPYPDYWQDDTKMLVLMSTFRSRNIDPLKYDLKIDFWENLIKQFCIHTGAATFCIRELKTMFSRGERVPACLDDVLKSMEKSKKIRRRTEYDSDPEDTWKGWIVNNFLKFPFQWSLKRVKNTLITYDYINDEQNIEWVHLDTLFKFCRELEEIVIETNRGKLLTFAEFKSLCLKHLLINDISILICLQKLNYQGKIGLCYKKQEQKQALHLLKIPSKLNSDIRITEIDFALHNLQIIQHSLEIQIETLEEEKIFYESRAREYLKQEKRPLAKTYLRKKKLIEETQEKRCLSLNNVNSLLSNVNEVHYTDEILNAYKIGSQALKKILSESDLNYGRVDEILLDSREIIEQSNEMQNRIMNANLCSGLENNIEDELQEIIEAEQQTNEIVKQKDNKNQFIISDEELMNLLKNLEIEDHKIEKSKKQLKEN